MKRWLASMPLRSAFLPNASRTEIPPPSSSTSLSRRCEQLAHHQSAADPRRLDADRLVGHRDIASRSRTNQSRTLRRCAILGRPRLKCPDR